MIVNKRKLLVDRQIYRGGFGMYLVEYKDNKQFVPKPIKMVEHSSAMITPELLFLDETEVQDLMDSLWVSGIRPTHSLEQPRNVAHTEEEIKWLRMTLGNALTRWK